MKTGGGAILQAYVLREALASVFAADVEVMEYRTEGKETKRRNQLFVTKKPCRIPTSVRDRQLAENFLTEELLTSSDSLVTDDHERAVRWIENQQYDLLVTGSDEVWKISTGDDGGFLSRFFPDRPFPNLYFLDPRLSGEKVAYAASANRTDPDALEEHQRETLQEHLSAYDHISVWDNYSEELLDDLGIGPVYRVPDPTFLIDIPTGDVRTIIRENGVNLDSSILGFHGPKSPISADIGDYYRSEDYQIVTSTASPYADIQLEGELNPFEYYALYDRFDMIVTSSLHSMIFSLKNGTPFVTIDVVP